MGPLWVSALCRVVTLKASGFSLETQTVLTCPARLNQVFSRVSFVAWVLFVAFCIQKLAVYLEIWGAAF